MARQKSEFLSALGILFEIFRLLVNDILAAGGSDEDIRRIGTDSKLREKLVEAVLGTKEVVHRTLKVLVNYSRSVSEAIAVGKYDWVNENITAVNFSAAQSGSSEVEVKLVHFNKIMSTDQILRELDAQGLRPATLPELLAIGEEHPELQREFPVVALGSVWQGPDGHRRVPCLYRGGRGRHLNLRWFESDWHEHYRFAAVSK